VQRDLLEKYSNANVRVYAVWFNMLASDERSKWPSTLLTDSRVVHRWDEPKAVGRWYARQVSTMRSALTPGSKWSDGEILWDSYLLYGAGAKWDDAPTSLIRWGGTIVAGRETLRQDFERLFGPGR
jgi:hypothetical protein